MEHSQVSPNLTPDNHNVKIRSAIDLLLSTNSINIDKPTVQLTECSPDIGVVMNKQGGICTKCNTLFKSKVSLTNHLISCNPVYSNSNSNLIASLMENDELSIVFESPPPPRVNGPNLVIVPNN